MRRLASLLLTLLLLALIASAAAILLIPDQARQTWHRLGLPSAPLDRALSLVGQAPALTPTSLRLYGLLEAQETYAMSELPGRIARVSVEDGDWVTAGQPLLELDPAVPLAQITVAEQTLRTAQAARDAVAEPPTSTTIAVADSAVAAAQTRVENARRSLQQAQRNLNQRLDLDAETNRMRTLIPAAEAGVSRAEADIAQVRVLLENARTDGSRDGKSNQTILERQQAAAEAGLEAAKARLNGLNNALSLLVKMRDNPLALRAQARTAEQELRMAEAALAVAEADRAVLTAPPSSATIAVAAAQVAAAQAALDLARWQVEHLQVAAPSAGRVLAHMVEPGETVGSAMPLFTIADLSEMEVRVYVPMQDVHRIRVGDVLPVETPVLPGEQLTATVAFIASEAQFRPNNVLNPDDRGDMVFLVKLRLPNPNSLLKPGLPADVLLPQANP